MEKIAKRKQMLWLLSAIHNFPNKRSNPAAYPQFATHVLYQEIMHT